MTVTIGLWSGLYRPVLWVVLPHPKSLTLNSTKAHYGPSSNAGSRLSTLSVLLGGFWSTDILLCLNMKKVRKKVIFSQKHLGMCPVKWISFPARVRASCDQSKRFIRQKNVELMWVHYGEHFAAGNWRCCMRVHSVQFPSRAEFIYSCDAFLMALSSFCDGARQRSAHSRGEGWETCQHM